MRSGVARALGDIERSTRWAVTCRRKRDMRVAAGYVDGAGSVPSSGMDPARQQCLH